MMDIQRNFSFLFFSVALLLLMAIFSWRAADRQTNTVDAEQPVQSQVLPSTLSMSDRVLNEKPKTWRAHQSVDSFSPWARDLVKTVEAGRPVQLSLNGEDRVLLMAPVDILTEDFRVGLGGDLANGLDTSLRVFGGHSPSTCRPVTKLGQDPEPLLAPDSMAHASMAVVGSTVFLSMIEPDGALVEVMGRPKPGSPDEMEFRSLITEAADQPQYIQQSGCQSGCADGCGQDNHVCSLIDTRALNPDVPFTDDDPWLDPEGELQPNGEVWIGYAQPGGADPTRPSNNTDLSIIPVPRPPIYSGTLKRIPVMWVVNKGTTGSATQGNLEVRTSKFLSLFGQVELLFENQVGFKLELQELILIPNSAAYAENFAHLNNSQGSILGPFSKWLERNRPKSSYNQEMSVGFSSHPAGGGVAVGGGYPGFPSSRCTSVGNMKTVAHEMGHVFGAGHTNGGIMGSGGWDFYTPRQGGWENDNGTPKTPVDQMYSKCNKIGKYNNNIMRNPTWAPFAIHNKYTTDVGKSITFNPIFNDKLHTKSGVEDNIIYLEEVGSVLPIGAGTVTHDHLRATFTPAPGFRGVAWFNYTIRGNLGNNGKGFAHRATVAITVGSDTRRYAITIPAGTSVEFLPLQSTFGDITLKPSQSIVYKDANPNAKTKIVIRARPDASGTDQMKYVKNGTTYTVNITYINAPPAEVVDDFIPFNGIDTRLRFNPLHNDRAPGFRNLRDVSVVLGGTEDDPTKDQDYFDDAYVLSSATSLDPQLGSLSTEKGHATVGSVSTQFNSGEMSFTRNTVGGIARIQYTAQDSLQRQATGIAHLVLPMVTIQRPSPDPSQTTHAHINSPLVIESTVHPSTTAPLTGNVARSYLKLSGPGSIPFSSWNTNLRVAEAASAGQFILRVTGSDGGLSTWQQCVVQVHATATNWPDDGNVAGYVLHNGQPNDTNGLIYDLDDLGATVVNHDDNSNNFTTTWSKLSGPGTATFVAPGNPGSEVTFSAPGTYTLRLLMDDSKAKSVHDFILNVMEATDPDTDGDQFPDAFEIAKGSDPNDINDIPANFDPIHWGPARDITGSLADFDLSGTLLYAWNGGGPALSAGGINFTTGPDLGQVNDSFDPYDRGGDADYEQLLASGSWENTVGVNAPLHISGLTIGETYQIQVWVADTRSCCPGRIRNFNTLEAGNPEVDLNPGVFGDEANHPGQFVIGTFVPTTTSMFLGIRGNTGGPQYNAIMIRNIPPLPVDPRIVSSAFDGSAFDLIVTGLDPAKTYELRTSTDLGEFSSLEPAATFTGGANHTFTDPAPVGTTRFYRIFELP